MLVQPFLGRLVVIGDNLQRGICAGHLRIARQRNGFGRGITAGTCDNRDPLAGMFHSDPDHFCMFINIHSRRFAGRADDGQCIGSFGDLPVHQTARTIEIDTAIRIHWRNQCNYTAFDFHHDLTVKKRL